MRLKLFCLATCGMAMTAANLGAQTFTTLYNFTGGSDGAYPGARLILSGNTLYGTAQLGGTNGSGTVFAVNTDGTAFAVLHSFTAGTRSFITNSFYHYTNSDGYEPVAGLILSGNTLYGTASQGGTNGTGTVFAVNTDGTGFTVLHTFTETDFSTGTNSDGGGPSSALVLSGNTLYGTAEGGGSGGSGTVFAVNTNGTGFTTLHGFTATLYGFNTDGANPDGLILSGDTLYGTANSGGTRNGTVFAVNTNGTGFTVLHSFTATSDGGNPSAGLILSGNTLYGTAGDGGSGGSGTVFAVNTNGTGFTNLYNFTVPFPYGGGAGPPPILNSDGASPDGLILSGNTLYGTAGGGGTDGSGTAFALNTDGTGFTVLHTFTGGNDGGQPDAGLILSGNTLYGTASSGTVFSIFIQPQLTLIPSGPYVILTWPTNYSGFTLQSTTNLGSSAVWTTNSSPPVVIGGQNVVINTTTSGKQQFYRLSQPVP